MQTETKEIAINILKSEMKRKGKKVKDLLELLKPYGVKMSETSFNNKISRGAFSAEFFIKCLLALEVKNIRLED